MMFLLILNCHKLKAAWFERISTVPLSFTLFYSLKNGHRKKGAVLSKLNLLQKI